MLGISLRDRFSNLYIRDVVKKIAILKWNWARMFENRPNELKNSDLETRYTKAEDIL